MKSICLLVVVAVFVVFLVFFSQFQSYVFTYSHFVRPILSHN